MSEPTAEGALKVDKLDEAALAYARKWNLVTPEGEVVCMREKCGLPATLPTLLCRGHLAAHRRGC